MALSRGFGLCLKFVTYLVCVVSFLVLAGVQVNQYFEGRTSVANSYHIVSTLKLPSLAFCSEHPFAPNAHWSADPKDYIANVPNITFGSIYKSDGNISRVNPFRISYLDTLYNGRCQLLESNIDMAANTYVSLHAMEDDVAKSKGLLVYFLNPGEEMYLAHQVWGSNIAVKVTLGKSSLLALQTKEYLSIASSEFSCHEKDAVNETQCLKMEIEKRLIEQKFECIPEIFKMYAPIGTEFCKSGQEAVAKDVSMFVLGQIEIMRGNQDCKPPCHMIMYNVVKSEYGIIKGLPFRDEGDEGKLDFHFYFPTTATAVQKQYYVHDFFSVLSAIGGGLGLFLGLSCLGGALAFMDALAMWKKTK